MFKFYLYVFFISHFALKNINLPIYILAVSLITTGVFVDQRKSTMRSANFLLLAFVRRSRSICGCYSNKSSSNDPKNNYAAVRAGLRTLLITVVFRETFGSSGLFFCRLFAAAARNYCPVQPHQSFSKMDSTC